MQKIEGGRLRGRRLKPVPRGVSGLRPTAARIRGAIFDRLGDEVDGARVLDLFAGSGALSIEALSRGASHATLVEASPKVARFLQGQLRALDLLGVTTVVRAEAAKFLRRGSAVPGDRSQGYDLVLVDPPFATPQVFGPLSCALAEGWLGANALVVCERERVRGQTPAVAWARELRVETSKVYGQAVVEFLRYDGGSSVEESHP